MDLQRSMAFQEGYYAARERMDRSKNPYAPWNPEYTEWYKGYDQRIKEDSPDINYMSDDIWKV